MWKENKCGGFRGEKEGERDYREERKRLEVGGGLRYGEKEEEEEVKDDGIWQ